FIDLSIHHLARSHPLFPSSTLFRSLGGAIHAGQALRHMSHGIAGQAIHQRSVILLVRKIKRKRQRVVCAFKKRLRHLFPQRSNRSEEHTSELQSREKLVCRLLLEKK